MNKNTAIIPTSMDAILAGSLALSNHILFLYISQLNKNAIQSSFLAMSDDDEKLLYVTSKHSEVIKDTFENNFDLSFLSPENIGTLKTMGGKLRIIMDMSSINDGHEKLEGFLAENKNTTALCMYDLSCLPPERIEKLTASHDRLILNTPDITVLSGEKLDVAEATIERFVKEYLDIVILALIARKPMCGTDILDIVHRNFNVLLSPGTIYPLLHKLKKEGLLEYECSIKKKVYKPARGSEANIKRILEEHSLANELLNDFLKSRSLEANTT
jgi:DNA-binding PadR family transcriptional regulator